MKLMKMIGSLRRVLAPGVSFIALAFTAVTWATPLTTVPHVDVDRYLGNWYQIAHKPLFFEGGTCVCARQYLSPGKNGLVDVYNSCNESDATGKLKEIRGTAHDDDTKSNSKFTVDFHLPFKGTYWIIGLDPEYRYAVVSDENKYSLYILSKTPELAPELYKEAVALAAKQLSLTGLQMTDQKACNYPAE